MKFNTVFICLIGVLLTACEVDYTLKWDGKYANKFRQGSGQKEDPYLIASTQELAWLAKSVNKGETYAGKYFKLTEDLDLNSEATQKGKYGFPVPRYPWPGIGGTTPFSGYFDGNNHRIYNISIDGLNAKATCGLFGNIGTDGIVGFLFVEKVQCEGKSDYFTGALAGLNEGILMSCEAKDVDNMSGGIAGANNGTIRNCRAAGKINGLVTHGGIVSRNYGLLENCISEASVSNHEMFLSMNTGGICGINYGKINCCAFTGSVYGEERFIGGISGSLDRKGTIENCYCRGVVKSGTGANGGIVGYTIGGKIRNCYNAGSGGAPISSSIYPFENCYYDTKNYRYYLPEGKSSRFMKSADFVRLLNRKGANDVWERDTKGVNDGYPVLKGINY